mmetsp:Transcript_5367/g.7260  ORF Transcript_5367/g.7260 Transcript_5367/m.7260 type:complete len:227 (-) Transcript_5367:550-1230(-)
MPLARNQPVPNNVLQVAKTRHDIIAWIKVDEDFTLKDVFLMHYGCLVMAPCFWPHCLVLSCCLCNAARGIKNGMNNTYWLLTERELVVVKLDYAYTFFPSLCTSGDQVKNIPLENITDVSIDGQGANCLVKDFPILYVDTPSSVNINRKGKLAHESYIVACSELDFFKNAVLDQRDKVKVLFTKSRVFLILKWLMYTGYKNYALNQYASFIFFVYRETLVLETVYC